MKRAMLGLLFGLFTIFVAGCGGQQPPSVENPPVDTTRVPETPDSTAVQVVAVQTMKPLPEPWPQDFEVHAIFEIISNETLADGSQQAEMYIPDAVRGSVNMFEIYDSLRVSNDNWTTPEDQDFEAMVTDGRLNVPLTNGSQYILAIGSWDNEANTIHLMLNLKDL